MKPASLRHYSCEGWRSSGVLNPALQKFSGSIGEDVGEGELETPGRAVQERQDKQCFVGNMEVDLCQTLPNFGRAASL